VIIVNPEYWVDRAPQLAQLLGSTTSDRIGDPTGKPPDPASILTVVDPKYWSSQPRELQEALDVAAGVTGRSGSAGSGLASGVAGSTQERLTLTVEEAATLLGISRALAYEAAKRGDIPTLRIGRRILVPKAALQRLVDDPGDTTP
jgi:excisionase family DNA binding protein